jgi:hypothetical protein
VGVEDGVSDDEGELVDEGLVVEDDVAPDVVVDEELEPGENIKNNKKR